MMKKIIISLGLVITSVSAVMANSTIYTDDIGRMHFLGKDPGGPTIQQVQNFSNPAQKDLTDIIYKNDQNVQSEEKRVNSLEPLEQNVESQKQEAKGQANKAKGSFTFNKGAMDASDPYTYGETNITPKNKTENAVKTEKKHFWDNW